MYEVNYLGYKKEGFCLEKREGRDVRGGPCWSEGPGEFIFRGLLFLECRSDYLGLEDLVMVRTLSTNNL